MEEIHTIKTDKVKQKKKKQKSPLSKEYRNFLQGTPKKKREPRKVKTKEIIVIKKKPASKPTPKSVPKPTPKPTPKLKPTSIRRSKRQSKKRGTRRLHKKHLKNRRVSFRCYSKNKNKKISDVIQDTKTMNQQTLKQKLKEKGIEIKSNQTSLIRDMFIFSELGGIHIKKE